MGSNTGHAQVGALRAAPWKVPPPAPLNCIQPPTLDIQGWQDKLYRRSNSISTVETAAKGLTAFEHFAMQRYAQRGQHTEYPYTDGVLTALSAQQLDPYKVLDAFAAYVSRLTVVQPDGTEALVKPHTVHNRVYAIVSLLRYHDVQVLKETFKQKVTLPKVAEIEDKPVTAQQLRILHNCAGPVIRTLILVLTSSSMRIGEAAQLRVKDIDFETAKPAALVHIRANTTKTDVARDVFISDEATQALQALMLTRNKQAEDYLFFPGKVCSSKRLRKYYTKLLRKVGKKHAHMLQRVEGHSYYNLHLHNLGRKWFFSRSVSTLGETAAHALMGHKKWWKVYLRKPLEERVTEYLRAMNAVSFLKEHSANDTRHFDVKVVSKDDEATVLKLLEQGYTYAQEINGRAVYKKEVIA